MKLNKIKKWEISGVLFTLVVGALFHFLYQWSGDNYRVALFAAVNESTWEHLKMAFWPTIIFSCIEWIAWGNEYKNFYFATLIKLFSMPVLITLLFYGWIALFTNNQIWDISIFIAATILGYYFSYLILHVKKKLHTDELSVVAIIFLAILFSCMTYFPTQFFLTKDPVTGGYGIVNNK